MDDFFEDRRRQTWWLPKPGGLLARFFAALALTAAAAAVVAATVTGEWWYVWRAWAFVLVGGLAGAGVAWAVRPVRPTGTSAAPSRPQTDGLEQVPDRQHRLAVALVELLDLVPTDSLRYRVQRALSDAGIAEYQADGEVFDPERHHVVDVESTDDPALESRVAQTVRPGYADGQSVVRAADVLLYRGLHTSPTRPRRTAR